MIATALRQFLAYEHRLWVVIIVTCLVLIAVTWPAVDEYRATRERLDSLKTNLASTEATIAELTTFESRVEEKKTRLAKLERKTLPEQSVQQFRHDIVQMVRDSGCQMRRIRLDKARQREWKKNDDPLEARPGDEKNETPFELRTQPFGLSVTGTMASITKLLSLIDGRDHLIHCYSFNLQQSDSSPDAVVLDVELLLFDLVRKDPQKTAA